MIHNTIASISESLAPEVQGLRLSGYQDCDASAEGVAGEGDENCAGAVGISELECARGVGRRLRAVQRSFEDKVQDGLRELCKAFDASLLRRLLEAYLRQGRLWELGERAGAAFVEAVDEGVQTMVFSLVAAFSDRDAVELHHASFHDLLPLLPPEALIRALLSCLEFLASLIGSLQSSIDAVHSHADFLARSSVTADPEAQSVLADLRARVDAALNAPDAPAHAPMPPTVPEATKAGGTNSSGEPKVTSFVFDAASPDDGGEEGLAGRESPPGSDHHLEREAAHLSQSEVEGGEQDSTAGGGDPRAAGVGTGNAAAAGSTSVWSRMKNSSSKMMIPRGAGAVFKSMDASYLGMTTKHGAGMFKSVPKGNPSGIDTVEGKGGDWQVGGGSCDASRDERQSSASTAASHLAGSATTSTETASAAGATDERSSEVRKCVGAWEGVRAKLEAAGFSEGQSQDVMEVWVLIEILRRARTTELPVPCTFDNSGHTSTLDAWLLRGKANTAESEARHLS